MLYTRVTRQLLPTFMAFFQKGAVKDTTTKESRKADHALSVLKTMQKNPSWKPSDHKSKMIASMKGDDISKLFSSASHHHGNNAATKTSVQLEVEADIHRRIHSLGQSNLKFEPSAKFACDEKLAADAPYLVQGMDPEAMRSCERFTTGRKITVQRKHWVASMQGYRLTPYGMAYIHTDGSIGIFQHGKPSGSQCPCGALHMA